MMTSLLLSKLYTLVKFKTGKILCYWRGNKIYLCTKLKHTFYRNVLNILKIMNYGMNTKKLYVW